MANQEHDKPDSHIPLQRARNRFIEYLEVASSFEEQRAFQAKEPEVDVPNEVIQQWEDWVSEDWETQLIEPVFSASERAGIVRFGSTWKAVTEKVPSPLLPLEAMLAREEWEQLRAAAETLLAVFNVRGKLAENVEDV